FSDVNDVVDEVVNEHTHEEEGKEMGGTLASLSGTPKYLPFRVEARLHKHK
ncbi:hypothetical protein KI387_020371, partial [Taxus chinensis]